MSEMKSVQRLNSRVRFHLWSLYIQTKNEIKVGVPNRNRKEKCFVF